MRQRTKRGIGRWALASLLGAPAGCPADEGAGASGDVCLAVGGYQPQCEDLTDCEAAIIRDCAPLQSALAPAFADAFAGCMLGLGDPMGCLIDAVVTTPSSAAVSEFATTYCLECGDGAGACEDEVGDGRGDSDEARAGRIARALHPDVLGEVTAECATGDECGADFYDCAVDILGRTLPDETSGCVLAAAAKGNFGGCGPADDDTNDDTNEDAGTATHGTDVDTGSDDGMDDEPNDDDTGVCTTPGCPCMFSEECDEGLTCSGDACVAPLDCDEDDHEPNATEDTASVRSPIGDGDGRGSQVTGLLDSPNDVDWFRYAGTDNFGAVVNPYGQLNVVALELCLHADCVSGLETTQITCPAGTTQTPSPEGRPGCCAAGTMGFEIDLSCTDNPLVSDDATIYMSVRGSEAGVCQEFTLSYHY